MSRCRCTEESQDSPAPGQSLDVGPLGDRPVDDSGFVRALTGFRTRLAAFGLGTPPSPILAPESAASCRRCGADQTEDR
ncbi:MAG TPA: hypothetical protein VJ773_03675 [Gemmatimonadales bacterium]|nr:hypothetical protein [Gemmatimonadales bacterium]